MKFSYSNIIFNRTLIAYLCFALLVIGFVPSNLYAMFLPASLSGSGETSPSREQNIQVIQKVLESRILQQRLQDLGLSADQIASRLSQLTDEQLHQVSSRIDAIQTGGGDDPLGFIIALLVVAILVVVLLQLTGHKVIITR